MSTTKRHMGQREVLTRWLFTQPHPKQDAEPWERTEHRLALVRAFKRGVKFARTGK